VETTNSGDVTWYRSSSTGRTTLREALASAGRATTTTSPPAGSSPTLAAAAPTLPFPPLTPQYRGRLISSGLLAFPGAGGGLRGE
jgi:hypothetical protein